MLTTGSGSKRHLDIIWSPDDPVPDDLDRKLDRSCQHKSVLELGSSVVRTNVRQITANPRINGKSFIENPHIQHTQQHVSYRISRVSSGRCGGAAVDFNAARSMAAYIWQGKGSTRTGVSLAHTCIRGPACAPLSCMPQSSRYSFARLSILCSFDSRASKRAALRAATSVVPRVKAASFISSTRSSIPRAALAASTSLMRFSSACSCFRRRADLVFGTGDPGRT